MSIDSMTNFIEHFKNLIIGSFLDGWDNALEILLIIMVLDYITGLASALKRKQLVRASAIPELSRRLASL